MSRFFSITKVILKSSLNFNGFKRKKGQRAGGKNSSTIFMIIFAFLFLFVGFSQFMTYRSVFDAANQAGVLPSFIESMVPYGIIFLLVFSMTVLVSVFFLSNDNSVFMPLPIKPIELFFSRFISVLLYTYFIELVFVFPLMLAYDFVITPSIITYLSQFLTLLFLPVIPIGVGFLLSLLFAKIFNISKHKDAFSIVMMSVLIVVVVVIQLLSGTNETDDPSAIQAMENPFKFLNFYTGFFSRGLLNDNAYGLGQVAIISAISLGFVSICVGIAMVFYTKSLKGSDDGRAKRKSGDFNKALKNNSYNQNQLVNFFKKETRCLFRTPSYVFNLVATPVLFVLIFAISFLVYGFNDGFQSFSTVLASLRGHISPYLTMNNGFGILIAICLTTFIASMSPIASTAISRESSNAYMLKTYPVNPLTIINSKISLAFLVDFIFSFILFLSATLLLQIPFVFFIITLFLSVLVNLLSKYLLILLDLKYPTLNAANETAVVKQSKSALFGILIDLAIAVAFGLLAYLAYEVKLNGWIVFGVLALVLGLLNAWVILFIKYKGNHVFDHI